MKPRINLRHPLNQHFGRAAIAKGVSKHFTSFVINAKTKCMWIFAWWSFTFLMHHTPIKAIDYAIDVIREFMLKTSAENVNDVNLKRDHHLVKLLMVIGVSIQQRISL